MRRRVATLAVALVLDVALGEPPSSVHPVVLIGKAISRLEANARGLGHPAELAYGAAMALGIPAAAGLAGLAVDRLASRLPMPFGVLAVALMLKSTFAARALFDHVERVRVPLEHGQIEAARANLQMIVSRDTSQLAAPLVAAAAIESLAENASDSFVAPTLFFAAFGPAGALTYRAMNTLDAMIGYHGRYEYLGKAAARLDDLANVIPARLTAALIALASPVCGGDARRAWRIAVRDHARTESPNAGWPMSAIAGALGVELEKVGHYRLGDPAELPSSEQLRRSVRIVLGALWLASFLVLLLAAAREAAAR